MTVMGDEAMAAMSKAVWALALELPKSVHQDVERRWAAVQTEVARLTAERDALAERVCPYVVTSDEGTSYCSLNLTEDGS